MDATSNGSIVIKIVVDIETTGFEPKANPILEYAVLVDKDGDIFRHSEILNWEAHFPQGRLKLLIDRVREKVPGVSYQDVLRGSDPVKALSRLSRIMATGDLVIWHNGESMERRFLTAVGVEIPPQSYDTGSVERRFFKRWSLRECKRRHKFEISGDPHRAAHDVEVTWELYKRHQVIKTTNVSDLYLQKVWGMTPAELPVKPVVSIVSGCYNPTMRIQ